MRRCLAVFLSVAGLVRMVVTATAEDNHTSEYLKREGKE
jgi:hypothetical protein